MFRKKSLWENEIFKDIMFFYTFIIILLKSVVFEGFILDTTHSRPRIYSAIITILGNSFYSPAFYLGFTAIFLSLAFLFKNRKRLWYYISFNTVVSVIFLIDLWYIRGFKTLPTLFILQQGANLDNLSAGIASLVMGIDLVFVIDIVIITAFVLFKRTLYRDMPRRVKFSLIALAASIAATSLILPVKNTFFKKVEMYAVFNAWDALETSKIISPIGYHIYNTYTFVKDNKRISLTDQQKKEIKDWFDAKKENIPDNAYKGMLKGKNLIFIQVESLENFQINQSVNGQEITPVLNGLLKNSLYFKNFHDQINGGSSSDADLLANTSVYPIREGSTFFRYPMTTYNSLPKLMKGMGYYTMAAHPDKGSFWNWMPALTTMGFDKCVDNSQLVQDEVIYLGPSDESFLRQMESRIKELPQPFYSFNITLSSHMPFDWVDKYKELNLGNDELEKSHLGGYFHSVHYTDKQIGMFINLLKKDNLLDNSVLVFYGDHESIHRYYPEEIKKIQPAQDWWQENNRQIPLIIYNPSIEGKVFETEGAQVDILPTVSYLMGVDESKYINTAIGRNLLKTNKSFAVLANGTYVGDAASEEEKQSRIKGLEIADIIIRSNYFSENK